MRIIYFSTDNSKASGAFRVLVELSKRLKELGHDVLVVLPYGGNGTKMLKSANIDHKTIYTFSWIKHITKNIFIKAWDYFSHYAFLPNNFIAEKRIKKVIRKFSPDAAIINTVYSYVGAKCCLDLGIPYAWCVKEDIRNHGKQSKTWFNLEYTRYLFNHSDKIICASNKMRDAHLDLFDADKMICIYEGVDEQRYFDKDKELFQEEKIHFINVGRINSFKGQDIIIKALNKLNNIDFDLTLVGYYHGAYKNKLFNSCDFKDNISFIGEVSDVRPYLKAADIFIMPSAIEAFGLVTVEASLAGLYVIGANAGGTKEIMGVLQGTTFIPDNADDLLKQIKKCLENKANTRKIAKENQKAAMNNFSSNSNAKKIADTLQEIVGNRK